MITIIQRINDLSNFMKIKKNPTIKWFKRYKKRKNSIRFARRSIFLANISKGDYFSSRI